MKFRVTLLYRPTPSCACARKQVLRLLGLVRANQEPTCTQELLMINENGLQATFRFFGRRDNKYKFKEVDGVYRLHWVPRQGDPPQPAQLSDEPVLSYSFDLALKGAPYFQGWIPFGHGLSASSSVPVNQ